MKGKGGRKGENGKTFFGVARGQDNRGRVQVEVLSRQTPQATEDFKSDPIARALADGEEHGYARGARDERAACVELVRAAGCLCSELNPWTAPTGSRFACWDGDELEQHDDRCPHALAVAIEGRK